MKAAKIVVEIDKLNKLGILKKGIVIKKGKEEDVEYLADTYIASVNTLPDDEIPEDVAKFYNELGDEMDNGTLLVVEEAIEEKIPEKKPAKAKDKPAVEKEAKRPIKEEVAKAKETKKEVMKEKPAKIIAKGKVENKEKKETGKKVRTEWKAGSVCDKIHQLINSAGDKGISLKDAATKANKFSAKESYVKAVFSECVRFNLAIKKDEKYFSTVKK